MKFFCKSQKDTTPRNTVRKRRGIFNLNNTERNVYKILVSSFNKKENYFSQSPIFKKYQEKILAIAIFLFITSPFFYQRKSERLFNFHWREYTKIFSKKDASHFLNCSVLYLLENSQFTKQDEKIVRIYLPQPAHSFNETYVLTIINKSTENDELNLLGVRFDKYLNLIYISLRLFEIIRYEICRDCSKVLELVKLSNIWKDKISEIFGFKSEYISFLYFLNLRVSKRNKWNKWFFN
ncbi:hypothetical protein OVS_02970 [Mycoplasma ovis str. Michigan]|uniref:Uncharacterized protein n=1 Tax=Mycoplasma ovis str. Michigan TaxID=1415773 RepID=A0ABM5P0R9_9MOLU|nr:hypothetical protein [Mycoplasma ovis]AHC40014.1 hypothetical protein OVS_02970 [Mycoplasma ovis str. Michigan]